MTRYIVFLIAFLITNFIDAKNEVPAIVYTLDGDTVSGTLTIKSNPCKLSDKDLLHLNHSIQFTDSKGEIHNYTPSDIKGFAILCKGKVANSFTSLHLSEEIIDDKSWIGTSDTLKAVFGHVIIGNGFLKQYTFTGFRFVPTGTGGGRFTLVLLKKDSEPNPIIVKDNGKALRKQLLDYLGDCPKVKTILEIPAFSAKKGFKFIVSDYNTWHNSNN
ncbi:MAG: hypothetical protein IT258_12125 [Saprospiraceae bacterium]|nr:hypothetical protein [Saprospiraceae bacterium]